MSNDFPVGYIICLNCGRPALWLMEDTTHVPMGNNVHVGINYRLVNINRESDLEIDLDFFCDSCGKQINESNLQSTYITFIKELDTKHLS